MTYTGRACLRCGLLCENPTDRYFRTHCGQPTVEVPERPRSMSSRERAEQHLAWWKEHRAA